MKPKGEFGAWRNASVVLVLWLVAVAGFVWRSGAQGIGGLVASAIFAIVLLATLAFTDPRVVEFLRRLARRGPGWVVLFPLLAWVLAAAYSGFVAHGPIPWALLAYALVPAILARLASLTGSKPNLWDLLAILAIWFPVELDWISGPPLPPGRGVVGLGSLLAMPLALYAFLAVRRVAGVGFHLDFRSRELGWAFVYFLAFIPFALILGLPTGFIRPSTEFPSLARIVFTLVAIFLFTGIPEEVLFRGLIQNLLAQRLGEGGRWKPISLAVTSVIFGWAHVNNRVPPLAEWHLGPLGTIPVPWVYVVLATIAGVFYGLAYLRTGKVTAAAIVHALVDATWSLAFAG